MLSRHLEGDPAFRGSGSEEKVGEGSTMKDMTAFQVHREAETDYAAQRRVRPVACCYPTRHTSTFSNHTVPLDGKQEPSHEMRVIRLLLSD